MADYLVKETVMLIFTWLDLPHPGLQCSRGPRIPAGISGPDHGLLVIDHASPNLSSLSDRLVQLKPDDCNFGGIHLSFTAYAQIYHACPRSHALTHGWHVAAQQIDAQ